MDNRCVVFYDSGAGGLRLFEKTRKAFPSENYVYFADEKYMPFGDKSKEELLKIFDEAEKKILSFLYFDYYFLNLRVGCNSNEWHATVEYFFS